MGTFFIVEIPRHWRLNEQRYGLVGVICAHCDQKMFPKRNICDNCGDQVEELYTFSGNGEVCTYTTVYKMQNGIEDITPYTIALIKLEEGPVITAQLTDVEIVNVEIGMSVEMVTRKLKNDKDDDGRELILYGYKFRPKVTSSMEASNSSR